MATTDTTNNNTVLVELVCDRSPKDDCRGGTGIIWSGKGDVQPYPRALWTKLAVHPDVWKLHDADADRRAREEQSAAIRIAQDSAEADRLAAEQQSEADRTTSANELMGQNTDSEVVIVDPTALADGDGQPTHDGLDDATETQPGSVAAITKEELDKWTDEEVRRAANRLNFGLHPRLKPENLRVQFLEAAAALAGSAEAAQQPAGA